MQVSDGALEDPASPHKSLPRRVVRNKNRPRHRLFFAQVLLFPRRERGSAGTAGCGAPRRCRCGPGAAAGGEHPLLGPPGRKSSSPFLSPAVRRAGLCLTLTLYSGTERPQMKPSNPLQSP